MFTSLNVPQHPNESQTSHILFGSRGYHRATMLTIRAVTQSDSGSYRCSVNNERGSTVAALHLDVRGELQQ